MDRLKIQGVPNPQADHHHEHKDVNARALLLFALTLLALAFIIHVVIWWYMNFMNNHPHPVPNAPTSPLARTQQVPPPPQLQESPQSDLAAFRKAEEAKLHTYGWSQGNPGHIRIPIEQAKDRFLQEQQTAPNPAVPNTAGGNAP